jgi:hypothetical protein
MLINWKNLHDLADDKFVELCQRTHLRVSKDLSAVTESVNGGDTKSATGTLTARTGRPFALSFDDRQYLGDFLGLPESMQNDFSGLAMRQGGHRLLLLTPPCRV